LKGPRQHVLLHDRYVGTITDFNRDQKRYRSTFVDHAGPGPWPCVFCGEAVEPEEAEPRRRLVVHHLDHDRSNGAPENLSASHRGCHQSHHLRLHWQRIRAEGRSTLGDRTDDGDRRLRDALDRGRETMLQEKSGPWGPRTERQLAAVAENGRKSMARRYRCGGCDFVSSPASLGTHQKHAKHKGRERVR
jgi:hypothetical protein